MPVRCFNSDTAGACVAPPAPNIPLYNIADITTNDASGVADSLGVQCAISGTVYSIDFRGGGGYQFYIYDATGGIYVFNFNDVSGYTVAPGDLIYLEGTVGQFRGQTQFLPDSIHLISSGNALITPAVVSQLDESTEGEYIELQGFSLVDTLQWPAAGNNANVDITNGSDTLVIRIDSDTDIDGSPFPPPVFNVRGAGSQFSFALNLNDGYQIMPSSIADFSAQVAAPDTFWVSLNVDMRNSGMNFSTDSVDVAGPFNNWPNNFDANYEMTDPDGDSIYSISIYAPEPLLEYKARFHGANGLNWEAGLNKLVNFNKDTIVPVRCFGADLPGFCPTTIDTFNVTLQVDLSNEANFNPATDLVDIAGFFSNWNAAYNANYQMTDPDGDLIYTHTIYAPEPNLEYKARYHSGGTTNWELGPNKFANFSSDTTMPVRCFNSDTAGACIAPPAPFIPTYTIAAVRGIDANGVADSLGVTCRLSGVVHSIDFDGTGGYQVYFSDGTGAINLFSAVDLDTISQLGLGDQIEVVGSIGQFRGLTQIEADSLKKLSSGNPVAAPILSTTISEVEESELIRLNGFRLVAPGNWPSFGNSANLEITNGSDTLTMRIDSDTDIDGSPAPTGVFDLIGVGSQFDFSSPFFEGYQILPRFLGDIIPVSLPSLYISEVMPASGHSSPLNGDWFEVHNNGSSAIDLFNMSWSNSSANSGTHLISQSFLLPPGEAAVLVDVSNSDVISWLNIWRQRNTLKILNRDDEFNGFTDLQVGGDQVKLYDSQGRVISTVSWSSGMASSGFSLEFDANGNFSSLASDGQNGAYTSNGGDVGSPGNLQAIGLEELPGMILNIYPNPTSGPLVLETSDHRSKEFKLYNNSGKLLWQQRSTAKKVELDLSHLPVGLYFLETTGDDLQSINKVVIH
jgi:DNA/RNA endonuclease YhcR with UshA esterase domain